MSEVVHIPAEFSTSRYVTFDCGPLFDAPASGVVTFDCVLFDKPKGNFITIGGHVVFIGDDDRPAPAHSGETIAENSENYNIQGSHHFSSTMLQPEERVALRNYTHHGDKAINAYLRGDDTFEHKDTEETADYVASIPTIDAAMEKAVVPHDIVTYRGVKGNYLHGLKVGKVLRDKGFASTSISEHVAESFTEGHLKSAIIKYEIPAGFKGAAPIRSMSKYQHEQEVLLRRGAQWEVTAVRNAARAGSIVITVRPAMPKASKKGAAS